MMTKAKLQRVVHALATKECPQLRDTLIVKYDTKLSHTYEVRGSPTAVRLELSITPADPRWRDIFPRMLDSAVTVRRGLSSAVRHLHEEVDA